MTSTTAQVSLYPLRQASLSPAIDEAVQILQSYDLDIEPGTMSTLVPATMWSYSLPYKTPSITFLSWVMW